MMKQLNIDGIPNLVSQEDKEMVVKAIQVEKEDQKKNLIEDIDQIVKDTQAIEEQDNILERLASEAERSPLDQVVAEIEDEDEKFEELLKEREAELKEKIANGYVPISERYPAVDYVIYHRHNSDYQAAKKAEESSTD